MLSSTKKSVEYLAALSLLVKSCLGESECSIGSATFKIPAGDDTLNEITQYAQNKHLYHPLKSTHIQFFRFATFLSVYIAFIFHAFNQTSCAVITNA